MNCHCPTIHQRLPYHTHSYKSSQKYTSSRHVAQALNPFSHRRRFCLFLMSSSTLVLSVLPLWDNADWLTWRRNGNQMYLFQLVGRMERWQWEGNKISKIINKMRSEKRIWWSSPERSLVNMKLLYDHKKCISWPLLKEDIWSYLYMINDYSVIITEQAVKTIFFMLWVCCDHRRNDK